MYISLSLYVHIYIYVCYMKFRKLIYIYMCMYVYVYIYICFSYSVSIGCAFSRTATINKVKEKTIWNIYTFSCWCMGFLLKAYPPLAHCGLHSASNCNLCSQDTHYPREMTWIQLSDLGYHYDIHHISKVQDGRKWYLHFKVRHLPKVKKKKYISGGAVVYLLKNSVKRKRFTFRQSADFFLDNKAAMRNAGGILPCDHN